LDDSSEEFSRLPDAQDSIPNDPLILANHRPWEDSDLQKLSHKLTALFIPRKLV
jgi:hypothetical protein